MLERGGHARPGAVEVLAERDEVPCRCQTLVIADLLQLADGLPAPFQRLLGGERRVVAGKEVVDLATRTELERAVAERARELQGLLSAEQRLSVVPQIHERLGQVEQERDIVL